MVMDYVADYIRKNIIAYKYNCDVNNYSNSICKTYHIDTAKDNIE